MNEPKPWREDCEELDPEIARLLHSAPGSRPMTAGQYARSWRKLQPLVVLAPAAGVLLWVKASLAALAVAVVGTATVYAVRQVGSPDESAPPGSHVVPAPQPVRPGVRSVLVAKEAAPSRSAEPEQPDDPAPEDTPMPSKVAAARPAPISAGDALDQELGLIERARALVRSNPAEAQRLLRDHAVRFPRGSLATEREMVLIEALMYSGRRVEARAKAESMLRGSRGSLYETRLSNLLQQLQ